MNNLREFIRQGPGHCGVQGINAERWAFPLLAMFDADVAKSTGIFDLQPGETIEDRLDPLNMLFSATGARRDKVAYFVGCVTLAAMSCAVAKGYTEYTGPKERLYAVLKAQEPNNAKMAAVMSVDQASTMTFWD